MTSRRTQIMAILNVTPDSFSDGGTLRNVDAALFAAEAALQAGADILDIGGESTRPGALEVPVELELARVIPVIKKLQAEFPEATLSVDTRKAKVAAEAVQAGAAIINDVSGLQFDPEMLPTVARTEAELVIMHSQGLPENMQNAPHYPNGVVEDVLAFFSRQIEQVRAAGIARERLIIDPGFGFGKTLQHNLSLMKHLNRFKVLGCPILVGTSRKSFLTLGQKDIGVLEREPLTAASLTFAIAHGATYVRIHDVKTQAPVIRLIDALLQAE
ncbi:MAG TPA: dihydropteroate synthase [Oculatellaceae cyanobacterium]|jgi:dihydropteroate synthase